MRGASDSSSSSKWAARASLDPFSSESPDALSVPNGPETASQLANQALDGKENRRPSSDHLLGHPNVSMDRGKRASLLTPQLPTSLLGKRSYPSENESHKPFYAEDEESDASARRNAVSHFELRALELHDALSEEEEVEENVTLLVDDGSHVGHLNFGAVALGERSSRQLTLENPSDLGNARVKFEGYTLVNTGEKRKQTGKRFKCDLHVCVVDALKSVTLKVTFEPQPVDIGEEVMAVLRFTVNDTLKLQCRVSGTATPRVSKLNRFGRVRGAASQQTESVAVPGGRIPVENTAQLPPSKPRSTVFSNSSIKVCNEPEQEPVVKLKVGDKRRSSVAIEFSPPRNGKRRKSEPRVSMAKVLTPRKSRSTIQDPPGSAKKPFSGSWWKQRQEVYDENWMAKQTEGFTKWMNYVLLDGTAERLRGDVHDVEEDQSTGVRRRFDFSSLRVLAQKRMESKWVQAAVELYHSPDMDDVLFNLQDEIGSHKLVFRADRPVYADVGLQEELIRLLNNYHPVWLCLGLYVVLGSQVMKQEKCSLRAIFSATTFKQAGQGQKTSSLDKMPQVLRRIILKHLVKDSHVAQSYQLVKNLMTPLDGSIADRNDGGNAFTNAKKNINGREYFDSLMQSFMLKFLMVVIFLDRAIELKADKFAHFPCLFRVAPSTKKSVSGTMISSIQRSIKGEKDELWVKNSLVFVSEFCRLFLASEGRIDKHLKQLGYTLNHEQSALDEIDLEIKSLETDLRDGIRLAKLMEALTTASTNKGGDLVAKPKGLSSFLRVPAQSRLQKVHNVEICLHFLQDKCGASVLDNLKSNHGKGEKKHRLNGRVRVSSSGFAGLRSKVDEKMVENLAKEIVNGHREKTLALLWKLISSFQLQSLVDARTMKQEIANVVKRMSFRARDFFDLQQQNAPLVHTDEHECYGLLLEWCRAVCANYNVGVSDFSSSFADGKALCYLLHYYHPMLLSKSDMLPTTSDLQNQETQQLSEKILVSNEQRHFAIINDRIKQLGEVPVLMPQQYNTKNPPEEKMVVTFVCYLQSRLMDSYSEIHAASRLKRWWKSPLIRLRLHRKKTINARVIQRFWYTSSQKRLAIRQCRKLLRAAHLVKSTAQMWIARRRFLRCRISVIAIQRAFQARRQDRINDDSVGSVLVIQYHWRKQLKWRYEKEKQLQEAMQHKATHRMRVKSSCIVIERNWLQHLSREGARLLRQQMITDRHFAATRIKSAWRQGRMRSAARQLRKKTLQQVHRAARVLQRAWSNFQLRREEHQRVLALQRFEHMMKEKELQKKQLKLKFKVETRAVKCVQKGFRKFVLRRREVAATKLASAFRARKQKCQYQQQKHAAVFLQRNVRVWRRRRQVGALMRFYTMLKVYRQMKATEEQRRTMRLQELKHKVETRAAQCLQTVFRIYQIQKRTLAVTRIQSVVRSWLVRSWYSSLRRGACLLQKNVRIWRRQRQLRALLLFRNKLLSYRRMQREEEERQECIRRERLRRLHESVEHRAASRIQSVYRFYGYHKRMLAATRIQSVFRAFRQLQQYFKTRTGVVVVQRAIRAWLAVKRFRRAMQLHRAAVCIQKCVRGWSFRRCRFNFYLLQTQLQRLHVRMSCWQIEFWFVNRMTKYRKKRTLLVRARWTQLRAGIMQKRNADVRKIAVCWRSFYLRSLINTRIQHKQQRNAAVHRVQVWWLDLCCKWAERQQRAEQKRQRELEVMASAMAKVRAERIVGVWLRQQVIIPYRERNFHIVAVRRLQAWWRGMLVRLHQSTPQVTQQRKKLSKMKLIGQELRTSTTTSSGSLQPLRVRVQNERHVQTEQPQTLGSRLDMALHMLLHGKRLQDMLFASHTIEVCTRYSRECCRKCVQLQISSTIFAAIRGLNRSRPHVELLHQLLLVLKNLTVYRRTADKIKPMRAVVTEDAEGRLEVDLRALDTLVDLLHIHRDMHHVFVLSANVITYYLGLLKPLAARNASAQESWSEAEKRLAGLQELLVRKLALYNATASFRRVNKIPEKINAKNLMRKMNPKTAVTIMEQLKALLERTVVGL